MADFIDSASHAFEQQHLGIVLREMRSILERLAHIHFLSKAIEKKQSDTGKTKSGHPFMDTIDLQRNLRKALYA